MLLDLRQPTLVVSGYWNPRIFGIDWIAQRLFDVQPGAAIEVGQVIVAPELGAPITLIDGAGLSCTQDRLQLYAADVTEEALKRVEEVAAKALRLLQHTPVFGFGVNFTFTDTVVDAAISDALITAEGLEAQYHVTGKAYQTTIALDQDVKLNLMRHTSDQGAQVSVNYHHDVIGAEAVADRIGGVVHAYKTKAFELLEQLYHQDDITVQAYEFQAAQGGGEAT